MSIIFSLKYFSKKEVTKMLYIARRLPLIILKSMLKRTVVLIDKNAYLNV